MHRSYRLALLKGDGIGPEIVPAAAACVDAALRAVGNRTVTWSERPVGRSAIDSHGIAVPSGTLDALEQQDGWLLGPHDSASYPAPHNTVLNPSGLIRKHFGLFANIRPAKAFPRTPAISPDIDLTIVRENSEGFYADRNTFQGSGEFMPVQGVAVVHGIITEKASERIATAAFELARRRRRHVTIVHKANVLPTAMGLFLNTCRRIAASYPDVVTDDMHIDAMTAHLLRRAPDFDVIVTENMLGDILSDLTGELAGSLGIAPSLNYSDHHAMAQAAHGSAPDIAGQDSANPIAMILSAAMLLEWLAEVHGDRDLARAAQLINDKVESVVVAGIATTDLGGDATTSRFVQAVLTSIDESN